MEENYSLLLKIMEKSPASLDLLLKNVTHLKLPL